MGSKVGIWSWQKSEPDLRSLYEYIDLQANSCGGRRAWILASSLSTIMFVSMIVAITLVKSHHTKIHDEPGLFFGPFGVGGILSAPFVMWYYLRAPEEEKEHRRRLGEAQQTMWQLNMARWQGNVKGKIGEAEALALNETARDFLRCRAALKSPVWKSFAPDSAWKTARDKAEMAMEAGMARMVTMFGQGIPATSPDVVSLQHDMRRTADEIIASTERMGERKGISGDVSADLRQVLGEMRSLNEAYEEVMNLDHLN